MGGREVGWWVVRFDMNELELVRDRFGGWIGELR